MRPGYVIQPQRSKASSPVLLPYIILALFNDAGHRNKRAWYVSVVGGQRWQHVDDLSTGGSDCKRIQLVVKR
jgi:hypothetical protein